MNNDEITVEQLANIFKAIRAGLLEEIFNDLYDNEEWRGACLVAKRLIPMLLEEGETKE